jgi:hypothetical protein
MTGPQQTLESADSVARPSLRAATSWACHPCNGCEHVTTTAPDGCLGDPVPHINCNRCGRLLLKTEPVTTCRGEWSPSNIIAVEIPPLCIKLQLDLL